MSQMYLNGPSTGRSISAEEFITGAGLCGCVAAPPAGGTCPDETCGQEADCGQPMICCCRPSAASPKPPQVDEGCCCKQSFRAALGLLCDQQISGLLDFDSAAFLTKTYTAGAALTGGRPSAGEPKPHAQGGSGMPCRPDPPPLVNPNRPSDNLGNLTGSFRRFAPCTCDLLDIDAGLYAAGEKRCAFTASQVSLCQLDAVVIQGAAACAEGDLTADEAAARNFRCLCDRLAQRLNPAGDVCGQGPCTCSCACDDRDCCCAAGLLSTLAQNNLSRRVSLTAGLLVLQNVTLLGTVGNVLVLCNDADNRLYFVCVNGVQFIG